ncbi:hypothetical protein HDU97_006122 [Phlyctochytrium planicorne]|nr:hypothetical protein HDU97_006122 [Phlyctochytrium planicorne]
MHIANILVAAAALASAVSAAAIESKPLTIRKDHTDGVSIGDRIYVVLGTPMFRKASKLNPVEKAIMSLNRLGLKHGVSSSFKPSNPSSAFAEASDLLNNAPLTNNQDFVYFCPVTVGNGQTFNLDLDTGSADTWVRGASCTASDDSCTGPKLSTSDSTLTSTGKTFSTSYGSGSVSGNIYKGPVTIGGATASALNFGVSTKEQGFGGIDGLVGLAFASISNIGGSVSGQTNFVDALGFTGAQNQFGFYLSNSKDGDSGEVTFGGYDSSKIAGPITYIPLNSQTYWQFSTSGLKYSVKTTTGSFSVTKAIADTGTSLLILDTAAANAINKAIGAGAYDSSQGIYPIACNLVSTAPDVSFTFGGATFSIPASVYIISDGAGGCVSGITQGASSFGLAIFGDTFLRQYYSIHDKTNARVGFALAKHPGTPVTSTVVPSSTTTVVPTSTTTVVPTSTTKTTTTVVTTTKTTTAVPTTTASSCAHSICVQGVALTSACDPCAAKIIAADSYCGRTRWDSICVGEVKSVCGITC